MERNILPLGLGMALAQNEAAMHSFESMTEAQKLAIIDRTHSVNSRDEMQRLVASLASDAPSVL